MRERINTFKVSCTIGIERITSPPPRGATPRLSIFRLISSEGTPNCFNMGKVVDRNVSTDGSFESFVIPIKADSHLLGVTQIERETDVH